LTTALSAREALVSTIPQLRAFAYWLCGNKDWGDDLVQDTLLSGWKHIDSFRVGTEMTAWLFTILRNHFRSVHRKRRRWVDDVDGRLAAKIPTAGGQDGWATSADLRYALARLPVSQREAVLLVGAAGMSVAQAASICGCGGGTVKSRVHRGRIRLAQLMEGDAVSASDEASAPKTRRGSTSGIEAPAAAVP